MTSIDRPAPDWINTDTDVLVEDVILGRTFTGRVLDVKDTLARVMLPAGSHPDHPGEWIVQFSFSSQDRYPGKLAPVGWRKKFKGNHHRAGFRISEPPMLAGPGQGDVGGSWLDAIDPANHGTLEAASFHHGGTAIESPNGYMSALDKSALDALEETEGILGEEIVDAQVVDPTLEAVGDLLHVEWTLRVLIGDELEKLARRRARATGREQRRELDEDMKRLIAAADALVDLKDAHNDYRIQFPHDMNTPPF